MSDYDPWLVAAALDGSAKWWWSTTLLLKCVGVVLGAAAVFNESMSQAVPYWVAALAAVSELCGYRMESLKGSAQALRRKLEYMDGLGWKIAAPELSDLMVRVPSSVKKASQSAIVPDPYFASTAPLGPRRLVENLCESAWFSKHLSRAMAVWCAWTIGVAALVSAIALLVALEAAVPPANGAAVARVVTALLMLVVTAGSVRLTFSYLAFASASEETDRVAEKLRAKSDPDLIEAVTALHDYQVARAGAPLIPKWVWALKRSELNRLWKRYRQEEDEAS